jgi:hypothetical protein
LHDSRAEERIIDAAERGRVDVEKALRRTAIEGLARIERRVIQRVDSFGPKLDSVVFGNPRDLLNTPV